MWARIEQEKVAEVTANDPAGRFHEALIWIECAGEVREGWTYQDHQFRPPRPSPYHSWVDGQWMLDLTAETEGLKQQALAEVSRLMGAATQSMAPLKDAVELDIATPAEVALYSEWRLYRVELNRIEQQAGFPRQITWPVLPLSIG
ncbi:tail fiber assembly protein [Pseudomonas japonica]|uniref:tail fiber assembly protein n=1 Tax=Pseudomonas japonica TaxID=256466 RepID=UPI000694A303|nr:tail fiber assembly protein [Pseudomonas japonica]